MDERFIQDKACAKCNNSCMRAALLCPKCGTYFRSSTADEWRKKPTKSDEVIRAEKIPILPGGISAESDEFYLKGINLTFPHNREDWLPQNPEWTTWYTDLNGRSHSTIGSKKQGDAAYWFRKAAELGHTKAQYKFGRQYERGGGMKADYDEAAFWVFLSADRGCEEAREYIVSLYDTNWGNAVPTLNIWQRRITSFRWYRDWIARQTKR